MKNYLDKPAPFLELLNKPEDFNRAIAAFETAILMSFEVDVAAYGRTPKITEAEVARRFKIAEKWFRIMRKDCGFGLVRALDALPRAISCELMGIDFDPKAVDIPMYSTGKMRDPLGF